MDYIGLGKEISYALRYTPWEYELEMDEEGRNTSKFRCMSG